MVHSGWRPLLPSAVLQEPDRRSRYFFEKWVSAISRPATAVSAMQARRGDGWWHAPGISSTLLPNPTGATTMGMWQGVQEVTEQQPVEAPW